MKKALINIAATLVIFGCYAGAQSTQNNDPVNPARVIRWTNDGCTTDNAVATFSFYRNQTDVSPVWKETQTNTDQNAFNFVGNVSGGLPTDIFSSGSVGWLELVCSGDTTNVAPRIPLTAAPYAISSIDSANLGGRPASDYVLASQIGTGVSNENLNNEISRAQQAETGLAELMTNETTARQNAVSALQLSDVATSSQIAAISASIAAMQSQIATLQAANAALSAKVVALTATSSTTQSMQPALIPVVIVGTPVVAPKTDTIVSPDNTNVDSLTPARANRLSSDIR
jgi:hypothetical protein